MPFRTPTEPTVDIKTEAKDKTTVSTDKTIVPYKDYESENGRPFVAEYYKLGDTWNDPNGGFSKEISLIQEFFNDRIEKGELPNNVEAIKEALKKMEKITNIDKNERPIVKIEVVSEYVKFLRNCDKIKFNLARYGK